MCELNLHQTISRVASKMPEKTAVEFGERNISYGELESFSNKIAGLLLKNMGENRNIAVFMDRCDYLVGAAVGILKADAVFVPIDVRLPYERIRMMLDLIKPDWVVTCSEWMERLTMAVEGFKNLNALVLDTNEVKKFQGNLCLYNIDDCKYGEDVELPATSGKNCYIYFTSGSTGKPKGILGRHRSLKHFIDWEIKQFGIDESFRVSQFTSPSFDPFLRDVFVPLCSGATLCIPYSSEILLDPLKLAGWLESNRISLLHMVPSLFKTLVPVLEGSDRLESLRYIMLAGELLRGSDVKFFVEMFGNRINLVNLYGPTETTLAKFFHIIGREDCGKSCIPVGKPIDQTQVLVLDKDLRICQWGKEGEIYIRTPFVSSGYYENREETRKSFIQNPFSSNPQDIIYKTGDIGRMNADGDLEVIGRLDQQVKLRGHRIELSEIESQLLKHPAVKDCVVTVRDDPDSNKRLCAYILSEDESLRNKSLRAYLEGKLPQYMIPSCFIRMKEFPLTPNGKTDRYSLPIPDIDVEADLEYAAPENRTEEVMAEIWQEVLGAERVSIEDSFYHLGGHSLKAAALVQKIEKRLGVALPLTEVLKNPTVRELSRRVREKEDCAYLYIYPVAEREYYPATKTQKRMYVLNILEKESTAYNIHGTALIEGRLDKDRFESAFRELVSRHDSLKTSFHMKQGELVQTVHKEAELNIFYIEASEEDADRVIKEFIKPFDLGCAPLLRVGLIGIGEKEHVLVYDMHHIISDAASKVLLAQEFIKLYGGVKLEQPRLQFRDYIVWQNESRQSESIVKQEKYWLEQFKDSIPILNLPTDFPRPAVQSFEGCTAAFKVEGMLLENLRKFAANSNITLNILLMAVYNILLMKYTSQEDIVVGIPVLGRSHPDLQNIIGMFVNTLAIRNRPISTMTFMEFLNTVKERSFEAYENQEYPLDELITKLSVKRDTSRNPLFDTMFSMHDSKMREMCIDGLKISAFDDEVHAAKLDISLEAIDRRKEINLAFIYCTKLFRKETIERMSEHFINILKAVIANPRITLSDIDIISENERKTLLIDFNDTKSDYPSERLIHELIEEQAAKFPHNTAVIFEGKTLTYMQLNEKSNQLAGYLREQGVKPDAIIGIMVERSFEMIIGIIGILKAGGAYLPIDPNYPAERIQYMLEDSGTSVLLTCPKYVRGDAFNGKTVNLESDEVYNGSRNNLEKVNSPGNLAYVIYTSGSTGKPKGVMIEHRSLVNRIHWMQKRYPLNQGDIILQKTPYTFDVSVWELVWWSFTGAAMCLLIPGGEKNPEEIVKAIENNNVTVMHFVPSMLNAFLEYLDFVDDISRLGSLKRVFASGEALTLKQVNKFNSILNRNLGAQLNNLYGPTEAAIDVSYFDCSAGEELAAVPIGKPIDNINLYILDKNNRIQPVGVPGELYISGVGLARGYLNKPQLTAERFVKNPFIAGERMYRTGDIAKWLTDGNIEYLGRVDHQVKIRGYRIELGEIEAYILTYPGIKEAVVTAADRGNGNTILCAYIVLHCDIDVKKLREFLASKLPSYMIPSYFIPIDRISLTSTGKVDRKLLPELSTAVNSSEAYIAPRNELERKLEEVWRKVLGFENIGVNDNFFEIGGNSILLLELYANLDKELPGKLKIVDLFAYTTISKLASFLEDGNDYAGEIVLEPLQMPEDYFVSSDEENEDSVLEARKEGELIRTLQKLPEERKIQLPDFLTACFAYLIYDLTYTEKAAFYTSGEDGKKLLHIQTDFNECEDFSQLIDAVEESIKNALQEAPPIQSLKNISPEKKTGEALVFFHVGDKIDSSLINVFDMLFHVVMDGKELKATCEYNAFRIKKQKAEAMLSAYIKLIKIAVDKIMCLERMV